MIRQLRLDNWRAYDHLTLDLQPGATFIVAPNGIGKTSLIEGAAWALYGVAAGRPHDVVRKGAEGASAAVDVTLRDGRTLTLRRKMPLKLAKNASVSAEASVDGVAIEAEAADVLLRDSLMGELPFLAKLTMLRTLSSGLADPLALDLTNNLSRIFGIDSLQAAVEVTEARRKAIASEIRNARQASAPSRSELARLERRASETKTNADQVRQDHENATLKERRAETVLASVDAYAGWLGAHDKRTSALTNLATDANLSPTIFAQLLADHDSGHADLADSLQYIWEGDENRLTAAIEQSRVEVGVLRSRIQALHTSLSELDTAHGSCPVCRRPLDPEDQLAAREQHEKELADLEASLLEVESHSDNGDLARIRGFLRQLSAFQHQATPPEQPAIDRATALEALESARSATTQALDALVAARAEADSAQRAFEQASSDETAEKHLVKLFQQEATTTATASALKELVDSLMAHTISPLADELANRWKLLFDNRGDVRLTSGVLSREVNGHSLSYEAFSEGEKASSQVLLRLLVLDAATRANFCWIDEPLEHLDPVTRRHVASMLARAVTTSSARQIVVTTYEGPLARRLAIRHPEHVHLVYVRAQD